MKLYDSLKNIGKKGIFFTLLFGALTLGANYASPNATHSIKRDNPKKYMIIYTGSSHRETDPNFNNKPNDKNAWWVSTARIYEQALKNGYKPDNIFVLYKDGNPDFNDPATKNIKDLIEKEFQGKYSNIASKKNLFKIEEGIEQKMNENDKLTLAFSMHGKPYLLTSEYDQKYIEGEDISKMLNDNKSKNNLILIEACYSGSMAKFISSPATVITSCEDNKFGWIDRDISFTPLFFENKNDPNNDTNNDGLVDDKEAFQSAKEKCRKKVVSKKDDIKKQLMEQGKKGIELKIYLEMHDFTPQIFEK